MLELVAASSLAPLFSAAGPLPGAPIRYVVGANVRIISRGGGFTATLWVTDQPAAIPPVQLQGLFLRLVDRRMRDEFLAMFELVRSGRGRMTVELGDNGKTIDTLRLDLG